MTDSLTGERDTVGDFWGVGIEAALGNRADHLNGGARLCRGTLGALVPRYGCATRRIIIGKGGPFRWELMEECRVPKILGAARIFDNRSEGVLPSGERIPRGLRERGYGEADLLLSLGE